MERLFDMQTTKTMLMQDDYMIYFTNDLSDDRLEAKIQFVRRYSQAVFFVKSVGGRDLFFFVN